MNTVAFSPELVRDHSRAAVPTVDAVGLTSPWIGGLDGLRAIAVIAVLFFHADMGWAKGGYLGVDLFFVLSGFLITGLLAREFEDSGRLRLGQFYWRRAKRLLPASWLVIIAATMMAGWIATDALPRLRSDALASLVYLTNWQLVCVNTSYFEATGRAPLLQHLWSLAIEEQFYIVWPLLVPLGLRLLGRRGLAIFSVLLALTSVAWMASLAAYIGYPGHGDPSRLYFGTDTHGFPLLLGAALGLMWQPRAAARALGPILKTLGILVGLCALATMIALFSYLGEETPALYPWGFLGAAIASMVLILAASHPGLPLGSWLDCGPMRWIGSRSYGIYLWHWPVFMLTRPGVDLRSLDPSTILLLRIALTIGLAALSYRYVETPIRRGALERIWNGLKDKTTRRRSGMRAAVVTLATVIAFSASASVLWNAAIRSEPSQDVREALGLEPMEIAPDSLGSLADTGTASAGTELVPVEVLSEPASPDRPPLATFTGKQLTAVGDSVLQGASNLLGTTLRGVDVHAKMGWQAADILLQLRRLQDAGTLRSAVLIHLGTNGYVYEVQLRQILELLQHQERVILVNTHVPRRWMNSNNSLIDRVAPDFSNVVVARWNDMAIGQPDYFISDGIHLTAFGQRAYIANIMRTGRLVPDETAEIDSTFVDPDQDYARTPGDLSPTLVLAPRSAPSQSYWRKLARCETDSDWGNGPESGGGLALTSGEWMNWGGMEFGSTPASATPEQQIEVANRMSTQGWMHPSGSFSKPIGFARWRCVVAHPTPPSPGNGPLMTYTHDSVISQAFHLGARGQVVRDLQTILGGPRDGIYNKRTRIKHMAYLKSNGLPEDLAGPDQEEQ